jgi:E3 ubiquitin-protein ligase SHPRH
MLSGNPLLTTANEARRRLRLFCELKHKATFCCGNAYFQIRSNPDMTEPDSEEFKRLQALEDRSYDDAKEIRRALLAEVNVTCASLESIRR